MADVNITDNTKYVAQLNRAERGLGAFAIAYNLGFDDFATSGDTVTINIPAKTYIKNIYTVTTEAFASVTWDRFSVGISTDVNGFMTYASIPGAVNTVGKMICEGSAGVFAVNGGALPYNESEWGLMITYQWSGTKTTTGKITFIIEYVQLP